MAERWSAAKVKRDIYLSNEVWRALRLLAKSRSDECHKTTVDELADELLAEVLVARYPKITEHLKAVDKLEREAIKALGKAQAP